MKLLFSEARPDYSHYVFPYAIWAFPEPGETPADLFSRGFLPSSRELDRFYLCRQIRVGLKKFKPSSENRRVLRKGSGLKAELVAREQFQVTERRLDFCRAYSEERFGKGVMSRERLESLFHSPITSHVMVFTELSTGAELGIATLFLQPKAMGYYYYAFYDLTYFERSLGMFMMTSSVVALAEQGFAHLYLGSCYSERALYKTQFEGAEFFNGVRWSSNIEELKFLVRLGQSEQTGHLLESEDYRRAYYGLEPLEISGAFGVSLK